MIIPEEIKNFIEKQKLGFVATVSPDGTQMFLQRELFWHGRIVM